MHRCPCICKSTDPHEDPLSEKIEVDDMKDSEKVTMSLQACTMDRERYT